MHLILFSICIFPFVIVLHGKNDNEITVATYNIWNVMFHWEIRKLYIAQMIKDHDIDVIAFQEVRAHKDKKHNQIHELQELLPTHKWMIYKPINLIKDSNKGPTGWEWEGIGLLSKHRILSYHQVNLSRGHGKDTNARALLSAQVEFNDREVSLIALHLSYDKFDQCDNAWDVLKYLHSAGVEQTVLLGDLNVYNDYHWPVGALLSGNFEPNAPDHCKRKQKPWFHGHSDYTFVDAWSSIYPRKKGFTFSNMPYPGLHSRPDRILVSKAGLKVISVYITGQGDTYAKEYRNELYWARLASVQNIATKLSEGIIYENSCYWDCGPNGLCRCGICVASDKADHICDETYCEACNIAKLRLYEILFACFIGAVIMLIISTAIIILKYARTNFSSRIFNRLKRSFLAKPVFLIFILMWIAALYFVFVNAFKETMKLAESQIAEELFPSDHLMLVSEIEVS